jgi:hypothetical protein
LQGGSDCDRVTATMATRADAPIDRPPLGWWIAILAGLALNAAVAFDAGTYAWWCAHVTAALPQGVVQAIFIAAVLTHVGEATYALRLAQRSGLGSSAGGWFVQTLLLGFPSLRLLRQRAQRP